MVRVAPGDAPRVAESLQGKQVAVTGRLASMTQDEAANLIERCGADHTRLPSRRTSFLVVGEEGWPFREDGRITESLEKARRLQEEGHGLEVISEQRFLELAGLAGDGAAADVRRLYTTTQLSRILKIPGSRIRKWVRRGLIRPVRTVNRLDYFDFRQVTEIKMLRELTAGGVQVDEIRRSLEQLRRWFPEAESSLAHLARLEGAGQLMVRLGDGRLVEPSGQLRLEFDEPPPETRDRVAMLAPPEPEAPEKAEEWFERALLLEEDDRLEDAARAYQESLRLGEPSAETAFNLGNVLYALNRREEAGERFRQAAEIDDQYVEAWNNLASVSAELARWEDALDAGRRAIELQPDYPDAHYNLAEAFLACGRLEEARHHGRMYLRHDPGSEWARRLRRNLGLGR